MDKKLLKEAFEAGRIYADDLNPYSGKPLNKETLSFTQWYNKQVKNLSLSVVSNRRELLITFYKYLSHDGNDNRMLPEFMDDMIDIFESNL